GCALKLLALSGVLSPSLELSSIGCSRNFLCQLFYSSFHRDGSAVHVHCAGFEEVPALGGGISRPRRCGTLCMSWLVKVEPNRAQIKAVFLNAIHNLLSASWLNFLPEGFLFSF